MDPLDIILATYCLPVKLAGKEARRQLALDCQQFVVNNPGVLGGFNRIDQLAWKFMVGGGGAAHFTGTACPWDDYDSQYTILNCVRAIMALYNDGGVFSQSPPADIIGDVDRAAQQYGASPFPKYAPKLPKRVEAIDLGGLPRSRTAFEEDYSLPRVNTSRKKTDLPPPPNGYKAPNTASQAVPYPHARGLPFRVSARLLRQTAQRRVASVEASGSGSENAEAEAPAVKTEVVTQGPSKRKAAREAAKQGANKKLVRLPDVEFGIGTRTGRYGRRSSSRSSGINSWGTWDSCSVNSPSSTD
ncbi:hypothetical protein AYO20_00064 [Fonsecaea nubica]|uniref:Uncharacterized protein n=1 Tax=Fonsecaea nubica TaxID=856822 RepID=A0A178DE89_9EURO|nr:hypothetical protein AYO20_00064 [Fonsecaea nubica]OAL40328.1 hypothetical protein AYO20_00064 [Fonsecaea nubica]